MIPAPGFYPGFTTAEYLADPCPVPSLNQSVAKVLLSRSPAHARLAHPRLSAQLASDHTKYDIGSIAHALLLGRGKEIVVLDFDDWRTKAAKEAREDAASASQLAVLSRDYETATEMVVEARFRLIAAGYQADWLSSNGQAEVVAVAQYGPAWLRTMIDWLANDHRRVWDYKTTSASANPETIGNKLVNDGWHIQAAFQERILDMLDPHTSGRREHLFVCQENEPPYALSIARLSETHMTMGRRAVNRALVMWASCMATDKWPSYPLSVVSPEVPPWLLSKMEMDDENVRGEASSS